MSGWVNVVVDVVDVVAIYHTHSTLDTRKQPQSNWNSNTA